MNKKYEALIWGTLVFVFLYWFSPVWCALLT